MYGKLTIFLLLAAAAPSSLAQNTSESSCVESTSTIKSDLAIIEYGQNISIYGLRYMAEEISNEILSILTEKTSGGCSQSGNSDARFELAKKKAFDSLMSGIEPTLLAIKVFQPEIDVPGLVVNSTIVCDEFIDLIFSAINSTWKATNYTESQAANVIFTDALFPLGTRLIQGLYGSIITGKTPIPEKALTVIGCEATKAKEHIMAGIMSIGDQISILLDAIFNTGREDAAEKITAIKEEAQWAFDTEVIWKYQILKNLVVGALLENSDDIVTTLYELQLIGLASI